MTVSFLPRLSLMLSHHRICPLDGRCLRLPLLQHRVGHIRPLPLQYARTGLLGMALGRLRFPWHQALPFTSRDPNAYDAASRDDKAGTSHVDNHEPTHGHDPSRADSHNPTAQRQG
jgi:hypothetical protein